MAAALCPLWNFRVSSAHEAGLPGRASVCGGRRQLLPGYPSLLAWVAGLEQLVGCAVRCATCGETSLNMVSRRHLDEPFFHDPVVHAVERPVGEIAEIERFRHELWSQSFDRHRTDFAA